MSVAEVLEPAVEGYPARRLRDMAEDWLCARYPGSLIIREFSCGNYGAALIDLAAVTEREIIGVEIKGDGDSPYRLKLQVPLYSKAAQRMWLLPAPSLFERCKAARIFDWKLLRVADNGLAVEGLQGEPNRLNTSPGQLLEALWADELRAIGMSLGFSPGRAGVSQMQQFLADEVPLKTLVPAVCKALRARNWALHNLTHKVRWAPAPD